MIIATGGAGFIGSNFVRNWLRTKNESIIVIDSLTYAGNLDNLSDSMSNKDLQFFEGNISDSKLVDEILMSTKPRAILHFAAESHVDRSIESPIAFIESNIIGTYQLLESSKKYLKNLSSTANESFRFIHISTDEVFGSLKSKEFAFTESSQYRPNSHYAASKDASDHLVRSYFETYGIQSIITHCSNNYGPYQFPEKLIPLCIIKALSGQPLPVYGDGNQVRDWIHVLDHVNALVTVLDCGVPGQTYNIGGSNERKNIEVVNLICTILDQKKPMISGQTYLNLITYVQDRLGHDRRYAINSEKIQKELMWHPLETFESGIEKTIQWYLDNTHWTQRIQSGHYRVHQDPRFKGDD